MSALKELDQLTIQEMSVVDIVYQLLKEAKEPKPFDELFREVAELKGFSEEQSSSVIARLYTEINIDGRFKPVGDNLWGLRSWYPVEQTEEPVMAETRKKKKKQAPDDDDFDDLSDELVDDDLDEELDDEELYDEELDEDLDEALDEDELDEDEFAPFDDLGDDDDKV
ncbi:DNA-directed RNA polymerase subunit delta [Caldalkalibacillus uzonensis]|uniref:Probable DNA-directed RNA polymerase subunit delta n=1 Tax=Caldalkalibacillus uzonensis TaxID=353224 RepID=A0ABU0CSJ0_9BACI|nr:DNA-directed RNA polymerase subunit delta [Caldalkalibacillus uzonensis]MDQ0339384.1 DNA-directed RNA polymerase subunit delta [Caldalkalibacillus uzonensis]